jgi:hypothetical protein
MSPAPNWFLPLSILALLWNLMGCTAFLGDMMLTPADIAAMSATDQALYAARPAWGVAASAIAVLAGALGCVGLILRKGWALPLFMASLLGVLVQDFCLFVLSGADVRSDPVVVGLQSAVMVIAIGLILLASKAIARSWITAV